MNKTRLKYIIIAILFMAITTNTFCAFIKSVEKTGTIQTKELSTKFLNNSEFLAKIQVLDSTITSVDKTTDLTQVTTIPTVTLTDENIVSTSDSSMPIYLWIDGGTIYYFTGATTIDLNNN